MTHTELISAPASWTQCVFQRFLISLRNFNQLDATSKVMYRHEIIVHETRPIYLTIICLGTMQWLLHSGKFVNKANCVVGQNMPSKQAVTSNARCDEKTHYDVTVVS